MIFDKLTKRDKFDQWRRRWDVNVRDLKPLWICEMAENALRQNLADPFKVKFKREYIGVSPDLSAQSGQKSRTEPSYSKKELETYNQRRETVRGKLFPMAKQDFKFGVDRTGADREFELILVKAGIETIQNREVCVCIFLGDQTGLTLGARLDKAKAKTKKVSKPVLGRATSIDAGIPAGDDLDRADPFRRLRDYITRVKQLCASIDQVRRSAEITGRTARPPSSSSSPRARSESSCQNIPFRSTSFARPPTKKSSKTI